jgi:hypothetical protein
MGPIQRRATRKSTAAKTRVAIGPDLFSIANPIGVFYRAGILESGGLSIVSIFSIETP